jgi:hypothetical protein
MIEITYQVNCMSEILVVLPDVRQHDVHAFTQVSLEGVFTKDPMVQIIRISKILGVLVDATAVVEELSPVDHVRDLGDVELVQLPERGEDVERLVLVVGDFGVVDLDGLVGFPEINLTVVSQVSVVV